MAHLLLLLKLILLDRHTFQVSVFVSMFYVGFLNYSYIYVIYKVTVKGFKDEDL